MLVAMTGTNSGWSSKPLLPARTPDRPMKKPLRSTTTTPTHTLILAGYSTKRVTRNAPRFIYRKALVLAPGNATAAFNLGTALQDLQRAEEAIDAYEQAVAADPDFADAHYNLSQLYERFQDRTAALRHLSRYKNLTR